MASSLITLLKITGEYVVCMDLCVLFWVIGLQCKWVCLIINAICL